MTVCKAPILSKKNISDAAAVGKSGQYWN